MHSIVVDNGLNSLELMHNENYYKLVSVTGLGPVSSVLKSNDIPTIPGELFATSKDVKRTLTFQFFLDVNPGEGANKLFSIFRKNKSLKITFDDYYIEGRVSDPDYDPYSEKVPVQITCECFYPYFKSNIRNIFNISSNVINNLEFSVNFPVIGIPFSNLVNNQQYIIDNKSNIDCGCVIDMYVISYLKHITIENITNNSKLEIELPESLSEGYRIHIDLESVEQKFTARNEFMYNEPYYILNDINLDNTLLFLSPGQNILKVYTDSITENIDTTISFNYLKDWVI